MKRFLLFAALFAAFFASAQKLDKETFVYAVKGADTLHPVTYRDVQGEWNSDFSFPGAEDVQRFLNENSVVRKNPKNARR